MRTRKAIASLVVVALLGSSYLQADDDSLAEPAGTPALTVATLQVALRESDAEALAAALFQLRRGDAGIEPIEWLSIRAASDDHSRRYPNAERLGRWLAEFDAALESVSPDDPQSLAGAIVERLAALQGSSSSASRSRRERSLLSNIASGRIGLSRVVDLLATRDATASDLEGAIARGRHAVDDDKQQ